MDKDTVRPTDVAGSHAAHEAMPSSPSVSIPDAMGALMAAMSNDPEYAWGWHCNIAVPLMDALGIDHCQANEAAAFLMSHLFGCDMTSHRYYRYGKSAAQEHHEFRLLIDRLEDEEIAARQSGDPA